MTFVEIRARRVTMLVSRITSIFLGCAIIGVSSCDIASEDDEHSVPLAGQSVAEQPGTGVPEISTEELQRVLHDQSAIVLDTRPHLEWSLSHIPGAVNVAPKPGVSIALYTSDEKEVGRIVGGDKSRPLVLYCNGHTAARASELPENCSIQAMRTYAAIS